MTTLTKSQQVAADIIALLRARNPLLWIVTREEKRVERYIIEAAILAKYVPRTWDIAQGVTDMNGAVVPLGGNDPAATMSAIAAKAKQGERGVWIMRDLPVWLQGQIGAAPLRQLRNLARTLPDADVNNAQAVIVLSPSGEVPPELANHATVIEWPLPDRDEIAGVLDAALEMVPDEMREKAAPANGSRDAAIDAALGLSGEEAKACYSRSLVKTSKIDPILVAAEKKRVVAREKVLEWVEPLAGGLDSVGGLEVLKDWLNTRRAAFTQEARKYGLPAPKGVVLVGVSGCGKSLSAKAVPTAWGWPMVKMDMGALKSKFVGDSEANIRKAYRTIEALGKVVVWIDEIEKAMQGATSGSADGGVSADALGSFLNWMQERAGESFVIATANDVSQLPPELLRKGRFDEIFFIDLPNSTERQAIVQATLKTFGRANADVDKAKVAARTEGFNGAEIASLIPEAMFAAYNDGGREPTTDDLLAAAENVVPLSKTAERKITDLREWAKGKARPATKPETKTEASIGRLDI